MVLSWQCWWWSQMSHVHQNVAVHRPHTQLLRRRVSYLTKLIKTWPSGPWLGAKVQQEKKEQQIQLSPSHVTLVLGTILTSTLWTCLHIMDRHYQQYDEERCFSAFYASPRSQVSKRLLSTPEQDDFHIADHLHLVHLDPNPGARAGGGGGGPGSLTPHDLAPNPCSGQKRTSFGQDIGSTSAATSTSD